MEAANLSVSITGDASELISTLDSADAALARVASSAGALINRLNGATLNFGGATLDSQTKYFLDGMTIYSGSNRRNSTPYGITKTGFTHYKKTHDMSLEEELREWQEMMSEFSYDSAAVMDIEEQIFAVRQKMIAEQNKALKEQKKADEAALSDYKRNSDAWIKYHVEVNDMGVDEQIKAYRRQLESYNAMVSDMAASTLYTADEMKDIWNDFYEYKSGVDLKIGKLEKEQNYAVYKKWQSDADNWVMIRDIYDDWIESGDSKVRFYERSIERIKNAYELGLTGWQEYRDDTMMGTLNLYKAKMEEIDALLGYQKQYIKDTKTRFSEEEKALSESWEVSDRRTDKAEISKQLSIYRGAVTQRGIDKYKSLQEDMKKLRREEEMYNLQKKHTAVITDLEKSYAEVEDNKKYLLGVIEKSGLNLEGIVSGARYDIASMQNTIKTLFAETISAIKGIRVSQNSYSDNRSYNISNNTSRALDAIESRVVGSIAHGNFY